MNRNIAVIGCGYWGKNLVRNFAELGALHTICDSNANALEQYATVYPDVNQVTKFESVLTNSEVKGLVISSPAALHFYMAKEALLADKDILVEKPLSLRIAEGEALIRLAEERKKILMVGHILEYHPAMVKLKELVDTGKLGKILYIYSNRLNLGKFRTEENILWSFAPHDISIILSLLNDMPKNVSAHGGYYLHENIADVTTSSMSFDSGARAHIFVSWLHPYKVQKLVIIGDKAMAAFDDITPENKLQLYQYDIDWIERNPVPHQQKGIPVEFPMAEPLKIECQHFLECITSRQRPRTDGVSALRVLKVLDSCQRSLEAGGTVIAMGNKQDFFIHETSFVENSGHIGTGTKIWHFCHVMPKVNIGDNCTIGQSVFIGENVNIGNNVKIQNNVLIFDGVTLEDDVFCGPACVFTNVKRPRSQISQHGQYAPTLVKKGATIGANATVICGTTIGRYALIGAGSVVTKNVPDYGLAYGNPARIRGWVCQCKSSLNFDHKSLAQCPECNKTYEKRGPEQVTLCEDIEVKQWLPR